MADKLGELFVEIVADTKKFDKGVDSAEKGTKKFKGGLDNLSGTVKKLLGAGALIAVAAKVADIGKAAIDAASRAEEVNAKFNTAFRGIETVAAETAKSLAESYGLSNTESEALLGNTGDLLKGFGATATGALNFSEEIQKLAVDLASYNNVQGGASRVSNILTKSVLGNKDGLSELGVSLLDVDIKQELVRTGQDKLTGQAGKLAKAQATFNLILQQTGDAQGDYIRTSDSYANVTRRAEAATKDLQAELGRALLPTATSVKSIFGELTVKLSDYLKGLNDLKALELAQKEGITTREQELNLLQLNLEVLNRKKDTQDKINAADIRANGIITTLNKKETEKLNIQINSTAFRLSAIEDEKLAEAELSKKKAEEAEQERLRVEADEDAEKIRQENYKASLTAIDDIIETNKTQIQVIDEEIEALQNLSTESDEAEAKRLEAIKILTKERKAALKEIQGDEDAFLAEQEEQAKELSDKKERLREKELEANKKLISDLINLSLQASSSILDISDNLANSQIANLQRIADEKTALLQEDTAEETALSDFKKQLSDEDLQRSIDSTNQKISDLRAEGDEDSIQEANSLQRDLDNSAEERRLNELAVTSRQERADEIEKIERDLALEKYNIELAQFNANKAIASIEAGVNTAVGITAALPNIFLASAVGAAGALQVGAILSQPEPPRPQLATGAFISGSQRGTNVTVGEGGNDEEIFGMGSAGVPRRSRFAKEVADMVNSNGNAGSTTNFYSLVNVSDPQQLRQFAQSYEPFAEEYREGRI